MTLDFQLVTPEKTVLSQELVSLTCPTNLGYITILPGHEPLVATLAPGEIHTRSSAGQDSYIFVSGGFAQVNPGSQVIVLADQAEHHYEIDEQKAEEAKQKAQKELAERGMSSEEYASVSASLEKSLARLDVKRRRSGRRSQIIQPDNLE